METLQQILESNEIVFLDTSAKGGPSDGRKGFLKILRACQRYKYINPEVIQQESEAITNFMSALQHPSSRTIEQVTKEIYFFKDKINDQINRLSKQKVEEDLGRDNQQALNELYQKVKLVSQTSKKNEWNTQNPGYALLSEMIILLNQKLYPRKDSRENRVNRNQGKLKIPPNLKTDERLVAAAYYCSLSLDKIAVVARDNDFANLFSESYPLLGSGVFLPYNNNFRCVVKSHLPELYKLARGGNYKKIKIRARKNPFPDSFTLINNHSASDETRRKILELWQDFNSTP